MSGSRGEWIYPVFGSLWGWACLGGMRASLPQSWAVWGLTEKSRGTIEDKSEAGVVSEAEDSVCSWRLEPRGTVESGEQCGSEKQERPAESCGHSSPEGDGGEDSILKDERCEEHLDPEFLVEPHLPRKARRKAIWLKNQTYGVAEAI